MSLIYNSPMQKKKKKIAIPWSNELENIALNKSKQVS